MAEVIRTLKAAVTTKDDAVLILNRGDELPSEAAAGEADRLRELGALGEPFPVPVPTLSPEDAERERQRLYEVSSRQTLGGNPSAGVNFSSDAAEAKAQELGVDASQIEGSGSGGAVTVADVEKAA